MYNLKSIFNFNPEPWNIPFEDRLNKVLDLKKINKNIVVYLYEQADNSTFRYRIYNMCQTLLKSTIWGGIYFFEKEIPLIIKYIDFFQIIIIVRFRWTVDIDRFICLIRRKNIPVVFDIDDFVYNVKYLNLVTNTLNVDLTQNQAYDYWFTYFSRLFLTGSLCDSFIGTNDFLAQRLAKDFEKPTQIISNFFNTEQREISFLLYKEKLKTRALKPFTIGYFSGTPSHINDFRKIAPEIKELFESKSDIVLKITGFMEIPSFLMPYFHTGRIVHEPLVDYLTLQRRIAEVDVNIVPLINNEFTNCKSELKFIEASIVGTITCAEQTFAYKQNIKNGINGFLCENGDWFTVILDIYSNNTVADISKEAFNYCIEKYSPEIQLTSIENMLNSNFV